jgi:hypothetical protein
VPDHVRLNAFRVLGLSVHASALEAHKAAASLRRATALGAVAPQAADLPALGEVPRNEQDLRMAVGRLENPAHRVVDRLFWFHRPLGRPDVAPGADASPNALAELDSVARAHDAALYQLVAAHEAGTGAAALDVWVEALHHWHRLVSSQDYRHLCWAVEEQSAFEPMALPSEVAAAVDDAVRVASEPLASAARDAYLRREDALVLAILVALTELEDTGPWAANVQAEILAGPLRELRDACEQGRKEHGSRIVRSQGAEDGNRPICEAAIAHYRSSAEPALTRILHITPATHDVHRQARELAGLTLHAVGADCTWAEEFDTAEKLTEEALGLVRGTPTEPRVEQGLLQVRESLRIQRKVARQQLVFGQLRPISGAPPLGTLNGVGFKLYGRADYDPDSRSYVSTLYFVFIFIPIVPLARYRVIDAGEDAYRFVGKLSLTWGNFFHMCVAAAVLLAWLYAPSDPGAAATGSSERSSSAAYSPARSEPPGSQWASTTDTAAALKAFDLKAQIERHRRELQALEEKLKPVVDEQRQRQLRIERLESEIAAFGADVDGDAFNAKVKLHNDLIRKYKRVQQTHKADLDTYQSLIAQDAQLVEEHNRLAAGQQ